MELNCRQLLTTENSLEKEYPISNTEFPLMKFSVLTKFSSVKRVSIVSFVRCKQVCVNQWQKKEKICV